MGVVYGQFSSGRDINHSHMAPGHTSRYSFFLSLPTSHTNVRSLSLLFSQLATGCLYGPYDISSSCRNHHTSGMEHRRPVVLFLASVQIFYFLQSPNQPQEPLNPLSKRYKVKQSHYRPRQAPMVPGVSGSQISRQSVHEVGKVASPTHRPP